MASVRGRDLAGLGDAAAAAVGIGRGARIPQRGLEWVGEVESMAAGVAGGRRSVEAGVAMAAAGVAAAAAAKSVPGLHHLRPRPGAAGSSNADGAVGVAAPSRRLPIRRQAG